MQKTLYLGLLFYFFVSQYAKCNEFLAPHTRPNYITEAIENSFKKIGQDIKSNWYYNGSEYYDLIDIPDEELLQAIINNSTKKDFYFLDAGAGNFEWGRSMACKIEDMLTQKSISDDINVHIISVRGEQNTNGDNNYSILHKSVTTMHNIGFFKLEDFESELGRYNIDQPFDLIVSRWTLRHLVDPTGTFIQLYNRLNPHHGILLADGFFLAYKDNPEFGKNANEKIFLLLANSNAPFLIHKYNVCRSLNRFIIQRTNNNLLHIPLEYDNIITIPNNYQCESQKVISFQKNTSWNDNIQQLNFSYKIKSNSSTNNIEENKNEYYGTQLSKKLFKWLLSLKLIFKSINNN